MSAIRECSRCEEYGSEDSFSNKQSICKTCRAKDMRDTYLSNKDKQFEQSTKNCSRCGLVKDYSEFYADYRHTTGRQSQCSDCQKSFLYRYRRQDRIRSMLKAAEQRAGRSGIDFSIVHEDIRIPEVCPVLGIPLFFTDGKTAYNTPSLDRIDSSKGYVPDNVHVISHRANNIKSDATVQELQRISDYFSTLWQ